MEYTDEQINKYTNSLPKKLTDFIDGGEWETKVEEIAKKYDLTVDQTEDLSNNVYLCLIGLAQTTSLAENLEEDTGVSEILAEQIVEDLDKRVFDLALKTVESDDTSIKNTVPNIIYTDKEKTALEIRPDNLPTEKILNEKVDVPRYVPFEPPKANTYVEPNNQSAQSGSRINYLKSMSEKAPQGIAGVPGFDTPFNTPSTTPGNQQKTDAQENKIIDNKLNNITSGIKSEESPKEFPIIKSYTVDPYREPLE